MYRTILTNVGGEGEPSARLGLVVSLAKDFGASIIGLAAGLPRLPVELYADGVGVMAAGHDFTELDRLEVQAEFGIAEARFKEATASSGVKTEWRSAFDFPSNAVVNAANVADLIVTGPGDRTLLGDYRMASAGDVLMRSARPVLVTPDNLGELSARSIVVAWKNRREARRAVSDALPFLKRAAKVHVLHLNEGEDAIQSAKDTVAYLAGHQIAATLEVQAREDLEIEDQLLEVAKRENANLIVAGAYGHTRFREWVLGGMTRGLLAASPIACLMSH